MTRPQLNIKAMARRHGDDAIPALLVSVRSVEEALAALDGGANIIDIKEPGRGPLGRADESTMQAIVDAVAGRALITAALGELRELECDDLPSVPEEIRIGKLGLSQQRGHRNWRTQLSDRYANLRVNSAAVGYADWRAVNAPPPEEILDWAITQAAAALLIDTAVKDGQTLFDHLSDSELERLITLAHQHDIPVALAGSLNERSLRRAVALHTDVIAVRGAACIAGERTGTVDPNRVRALCRLISTCASTCAAPTDQRAG